MAATAEPTAEPTPVPVPRVVQERTRRGRDDMRRDASKRRLCQRFERGDSYYFVNSEGKLNFQSTVTKPDGSGKPDWRIRNTYNLIRPIIQGKVSTATQRTPSYQVLPSTTDMQRVSAAELAEKAALYGYDQWGFGPGRRTCARHAIGGGGEGFAYAYFDPNVGPYVEVPPDPLDPLAEPTTVGQGEIKILTGHGNQVYWEPGCKFAESPWWAFEDAVPQDTIREMPGYLGGTLEADANTSDIPTDTRPSDQMVLLTRYFERPCPKYPDGRLLMIANSRQVLPEETYPLKDPDGNALDEPCILRLAWDDDDGLERDFGLTWQLIDCERTIQDCMNKITEWKNRCLNPKLLARVNSILGRITDKPGTVEFWQGPDKPEWENVPAIPDSLFRVISQTQQIMRLIASDDQTEAQADLSNVAAKTLQQSIEEALNRWQAFIAQMASWDARLMRHCAAGETLVHTIDGLVPAETLAGRTVQTLTIDGTYRPADWSWHGVQRLWRVEFEDGEIGHYTQGHQWVVRGSHGQDERVTTDRLAGRAIPMVGRAPRLGVDDTERWEDGVRNGLMYGDGHRGTNTYKPTGNTFSFSRMKQYGEDACAMLERFFEHGERRQSPHLGVAVTTKCCDPALKEIPSIDEGRDYLLGFIAGAIAADGFIGNDGNVGLTSVQHNDLIRIREIARHVGLLITGLSHQTRNTAFKQDSTIWTLRFAKRNFINGDGIDEHLLVNPGHHRRLAQKPVKRERRWLRHIKSVEPTDRIEDVYCCVEPATHTWVAESGYVTSNCLLLCARHYTEPRLLKIKGRDGWERVADFQGANLMGEVDVRVFPNSLVPLTRQGVRDEITWLAGMFPGWLNPQDALAAIQEGSLDRLTESYWLDKARANDIIQRIRDGTVMDMPARGQTDPITGEQIEDPQTGQPMDIPGYMPDLQDDLQIWMRVFSDWMKTEDFARQPPPSQAITRQIWNGIEQLKQAKAMKEAALQNQMAMDAGMRNAAAPQGPKPMPSLPGSSAAPPPKQ